MQHDFIPLLFRKTGVERRGGNVAGIQTIHLILHQGDQRRNDQRQAGQNGGRQLIAKGFPLAGGHHGHGIATGQHGIDHLPLAGAE